MYNRKKIMVLAIILILVPLLVFVLSQISSEEEAKLIDSKRSVSFDLYKEREILQQRFSGLLLPDLKLFDEYGDSIVLSDLLREREYLLTFFYTEYCCSDCVKRYFDIFESLRGQIPDCFDVVILSSFGKLNRMRAFYSNMNHNLKHYNVVADASEFLRYSIDDKDRPLIFIVERSFRILSPYIGSPTDSISSAYFSSLLRYANQACSILK